MLRLGLLASGHAAAGCGGGGVGAGNDVDDDDDADAAAPRDVSAFCRYISEERMNQFTHPQKVRK